VLALGDSKIVVRVGGYSSWDTQLDGFAVPMVSTVAGPSERCKRRISAMVLVRVLFAFAIAMIWELAD
jgi:hypothetical protein